MTAFIIVKAKITNREGFSRYTDVVPGLVTKFGGQYRILGSPICALEAPEDSRIVVISEWPNKEAADNFWNSAEYQQAKKLREGCGDFEVILVGG